MALQKTEKHPLTSTTNSFTGYWALASLGLDTLDRRCTVRLGLYYSSSDYYAAPKGNALRLSEAYIIENGDYNAIFPPDNTPPEQMPTLPVMLYNIFNYIKNKTDDEGNPGYFSDAEIVP